MYPIITKFINSPRKKSMLLAIISIKKPGALAFLGLTIKLIDTNHVDKFIRNNIF